MTHVTLLCQVNIQAALDAFLEVNPEAAEETKVIMVDKHAASIAVMRKCFPNAHIYLCQYHVFTHVNKVIAGTIPGEKKFGFNRMQIDTFKDLFKILVYSYSERMFQGVLRYIQKKVDTFTGLDNNTGHPFIMYLTNNWLNCVEMWASFKRGDCPNFGIDTNNYVESGWGSYKPSTNSRMPVDDMILGFLACEELRKEEYDTKSENPCSITVKGYDDHMLNLLNQVSPYAAAAVHPQYEWAKAHVRVYDVEVRQNTTIVVWNEQPNVSMMHVMHVIHVAHVVDVVSILMDVETRFYPRVNAQRSQEIT